MPSGREIRTKIGSVKNTAKITRAMEMVAASKMRKAQDTMFASRPYAEKIRDVISHLAKAHPEYQHIFLQERKVKRVGYIVISSDRGLCGSLNSNMLKLATSDMHEWQKKGCEIDLCLVGHKAISFFRNNGGNVVGTAEHIGESPSINSLIGIVKVMLDAYRTGKIDRLNLVFNDFVNTMKQNPRSEQLLPLVSSESKKLDYYWDYIYEPDAKEILDALLQRYVESQVYQAVVENIACEQAARMVAMKNATENAGELINELQLVYNKARQAAITQELTEIVAGADAV